MRSLYLDLPALCFISLGCSPLLLLPRTQVLNETLDSPSLDISSFFFLNPNGNQQEIFFRDVRKTTQKCVLPMPVPNLINLQEVPAPAPVPLGGPLISVPCHSVFAGYERSPGTIPNSEPAPGGRGWQGGCPLHRFSAACG